MKENKVTYEIRVLVEYLKALQVEDIEKLSMMNDILNGAYIRPKVERE